MKKVKFNDKFYCINNESFFSTKWKNKKGDNFFSYIWVIPVYVYSINQIWDGRENFDICPVETTKQKDNRSWRWRRSIEYDEIGKDIFYTKEEAWEVYNRKYNDNEKAEHKKYHQQKTYEKRVEKIQKFKKLLRK